MPNRLFVFIVLQHCQISLLNGS